MDRQENLINFNLNSSIVSDAQEPYNILVSDGDLDTSNTQIDPTEERVDGLEDQTEDTVITRKKCCGCGCQRTMKCMRCMKKSFKKCRPISLIKH